MSNCSDSEDWREEFVQIQHTPVGKGIFAGRPFPETAIIGEITGQIIDDPNYGSDYSFDIGDGFQLEPESPFCFVNHSCEPNCEFDWDDDPGDGDVQSRRHLYLIAIRDIEPGEEFTIDYNWPSIDAIPCKCQAPSCRGWVVDIDELSKLPEITQSL